MFADRPLHTSAAAQSVGVSESHNFAAATHRPAPTAGAAAWAASLDLPFFALAPNAFLQDLHLLAGAAEPAAHIVHDLYSRTAFHHLRCLFLPLNAAALQ